MRSLYLRIYATVVVVLLLFALASGWVVRNVLDDERGRVDTIAGERLNALGDLLQKALPAADQPPAQQVAALNDWSRRLRMALALDDAAGKRLGASESFDRRRDGPGRQVRLTLDDGRTLWIYRSGAARRRAEAGRIDGAQDERGERGERGGRGRLEQSTPWPLLPPGLPQGTGLVVGLLALFVAVSLGAYPVVRRLTRRLEALKHGVEQFGGGQLAHRVVVSGNDEVAAVAASFNVAAERVQTLVQSHRSLLANASHELRSPLARMKLAVSMLEEAAPEQRARLRLEIDTNVAELDALVEEVLLASRLDASSEPMSGDPVDLVALVAEEASRVGAEVDASAAVVVGGDERLLRRAVRNLLENARRYGGGEIEAELRAGQASPPRPASIHVCDRGPGVPDRLRERIFEPFYRLPGHTEQAGGVGLGLSLVRQIVERHGGRVHCAARDGGGSCFVIELPVR